MRWLFVLASVSLLPAAESFTIRATESARHLTIRYFASGAFGGVGGSVNSGDNGIATIPLEFEGKPAKTLKAILYQQGCQLTVMSVDLLTDATRNAKFECHLLPMITLRGTVPVSRDDREDVVVRYDAHWSHGFLGYRDGPVMSFELGKAPVDADGHFELTMTDFSKDVISQQGAALSVIVVDHGSGTQLDSLVPPPVFQYQGFALKILPSYDYEITFSRR